MQMNNAESPRTSADRQTEDLPVFAFAHSEIETPTGSKRFQRALEALGRAYARAADMLDAKLARGNLDMEALVMLGDNYARISMRRRLIKTVLESEPAILAYANSDCRYPEQIHSLAEAASELAGDPKGLPSALGLLAYIDQELGWSEIADGAAVA